VPGSSFYFRSFVFLGFVMMQGVCNIIITIVIVMGNLWQENKSGDFVERVWNLQLDQSRFM
jgi:TRAP-type mannitol/chloroaromatic compound transport system permease small subunit